VGSSRSSSTFGRATTLSCRTSPSPAAAGAECDALQPDAVDGNPPGGLDEGSRTSAALTQVLLRKRYGVRPEICPLPLDRAAEDVDADAVLLIGDRPCTRACRDSGMRSTWGRSGTTGRVCHSFTRPWRSGRGLTWVA